MLQVNLWIIIISWLTYWFPQNQCRRFLNWFNFTCKWCNFSILMFSFFVVNLFFSIHLIIFFFISTFLFHFFYCKNENLYYSGSSDVTVIMDKICEGSCGPESNCLLCQSIDRKCTNDKCIMCTSPGIKIEPAGSFQVKYELIRAAVLFSWRQTSNILLLNKLN